MIRSGRESLWGAGLFVFSGGRSPVASSSFNRRNGFLLPAAQTFSTISCLSRETFSPSSKINHLKVGVFIFSSCLKIPSCCIKISYFSTDSKGCPYHNHNAPVLTEAELPKRRPTSFYPPEEDSTRKYSHKPYSSPSPSSDGTPPPRPPPHDHSGRPFSHHSSPPQDYPGYTSTPHNDPPHPRTPHYHPPHPSPLLQKPPFESPCKRFTIHVSDYTPPTAPIALFTVVVRNATNPPSDSSAPSPVNPRKDILDVAQAIPVVLCELSKLQATLSHSKEFRHTHKNPLSGDSIGIIEPTSAFLWFSNYRKEWYVHNHEDLFKNFVDPRELHFYFSALGLGQIPYLACTSIHVSSKSPLVYFQSDGDGFPTQLNPRTHIDKKGLLLCFSSQPFNVSSLLFNRLEKMFHKAHPVLLTLRSMWASQGVHLVKGGINGKGGGGEGGVTLWERLQKCPYRSHIVKEGGVEGGRCSACELEASVGVSLGGEEESLSLSSNSTCGGGKASLSRKGVSSSSTSSSSATSLSLGDVPSSSTSSSSSSTSSSSSSTSSSSSSTSSSSSSTSSSSSSTTSSPSSILGSPASGDSTNPLPPFPNATSSPPPPSPSNQKTPKSSTPPSTSTQDWYALTTNERNDYPIFLSPPPVPEDAETEESHHLSASSSSSSFHRNVDVPATSPQSCRFLSEVSGSCGMFIPDIDPLTNFQLLPVLMYEKKFDPVIFHTSLAERLFYSGAVAGGVGSDSSSTSNDSLLSADPGEKFTFFEKLPILIRESPTSPGNCFDLSFWDTSCRALFKHAMQNAGYFGLVARNSLTWAYGPIGVLMKIDRFAYISKDYKVSVAGRTLHRFILGEQLSELSNDAMNFGINFHNVYLFEDDVCAKKDLAEEQWVKQGLQKARTRFSNENLTVENLSFISTDGATGDCLLASTSLEARLKAVLRGESEELEKSSVFRRKYAPSPCKL